MRPIPTWPRPAATAIRHDSPEGCKPQGPGTIVFKRRNPRTYLATAGRFFYPRGGWGRAAYYVAYRLRRLPDPAYKISRGIACGVGVCFTPFFGFHFLMSAGLAWVIRGNVLAALLATFFGNPVTFPIIATLAVDLGSWMLGQHPVPFPRIFAAFSYAAVELWSNLKAIFTPEVTEWARLSDFYRRIFLPYLVGGIGPGLAAGVAAYMLSRPLILAYQRARINRLKKRYEKRLSAAETAKADGRVKAD